MIKALVIVESPAKAKTINRYLGNDYVVKSTLGHIRDLPISGSILKRKTYSNIVKNKKDKTTILINRMGVDPYQNWKANYQILPGKEKIIAELKSLAEKVSHIYLATDLDREGEAIAWHLREVIGGDNQRYSRVIFNEITKNAISQAFNKTCELNIDRVNAQQARRFMDRVVGYMISPLLWKKVARGLSAGRVQSVAVRLVVEREREIKSFVPKEYWELHAKLITPKNSNVLMQITHQYNKPFRPVTREQTNQAMYLLKKEVYFQVVAYENKPIYAKPSPPFITSTLQQAASTRLGFSVRKTMMIAQHLYESGHITYMRTDSTNLSQDAIYMVRNYIENTFSKNYLPKTPNVYINNKNSQEAHEAIRPSNVHFCDQLKNMESNSKKLYELIWRQFIACQMMPVEYASIILTVKAGDFTMKAKEKKVFFDGWTRIIPTSYRDNEEYVLSDIKLGSKLILKQLLKTQHFTRPHSRFSEASLVKELEKRGIGRPSTYSSLISTIQERGYVKVANHRFYAEKMGEIVTDRLKENFRELMNYNFTANMEDNLDKIAKNEADWKIVLTNFFSKFTQQLETAEKDPKNGGMQPNKIVLTSIKCQQCKRKMWIRTASTGVFLGCSGYALCSKERCKQTINLIPEYEVLNIFEGDNAETRALLSRDRCHKCSTAMDSYLIDPIRRLYVCGRNPECDGYKIQHGTFTIKGYENSIINCERCGSDMQLKVGRFGKYVCCTNESCKNSRKILQNGEITPAKLGPIPLKELTCKKSNAYFVLREGKAGIFLSANTFPKSRETRAPQVEELKRFRHLLPEKLQYLADAPSNDPFGNKSIIRFSRKSKEQYVSSEKATGWTAFYIDGNWEVIVKKK